LKGKKYAIIDIETTGGLIKRDKLTRKEAFKRIRSQMPLKEKVRLADYVIEGDSPITELKEQIFGLLDGKRFEEIMSERGLVKDREPHYLEVDSQWSLATHY